MPRNLIVPVADMPEAPVVYRPVNHKRWWNVVREHPLTDEQFWQAALEHYFLVSPDHHIRHTRNHAFHLLKILHGGEIEKELRAYQKERDATL